jgi:multidrug efflux pump subunit AcrA (membrane-fusion protein)
MAQPPSPAPSAPKQVWRVLLPVWVRMARVLRRKRVWIPIALVPILLIALLAARIRSGANHATIKARRGPIVEAVYGIGTVTAYKTYQLRFAAAQTVRGIFVREGDLVRAGQTLMSAEGELMRTFNAPFAGTVTAIPYKIGEVVPPGLPLLTLSDLGDRYVVVSLEQQGAIRVARGQPAVLSFESLRESSYRGTVRTVFSNENQFLVHVVAPDLPLSILPGMTADVAIQVARRENAVLVPVAAVADGKVTVQDGVSRRTVSVKLGTVDGDWAEVTGSNLSGNEDLLVSKGGK